MSGEDYIDTKLIDTLARLSSIKISPEERKTLHADMQEIVSYVRRLEGLELDNFDAPGTWMETPNVTQPDTPRPGLAREAAFQNAPDAHGMFFKAPPIIEM